MDQGEGPVEHRTFERPVRSGTPDVPDSPDDAASEISIGYLNPPALPQGQSFMASSTITMNSKTVKLGMARRTLGILFMFLTIFLWTLSNFLTSAIFADDSYSKPYFVTWLNINFFALFLLRPALKAVWTVAREKAPFLPALSRSKASTAVYQALGTSSHSNLIKPDDFDDDDEDNASPRASAGPRESMFLDESMVLNAYGLDSAEPGKFTLRETISLSFQFMFLWFLSSVFIAACLRYTTVASSTVLGSTSSAFTLALGVAIGAEKYTTRKCIGVVVCLLGVIMISQADLSGETDANRGSFPEKSGIEMAIGDALALISTCFYALYTVLLNKRVGDEGRLDIFTYFGFMGLFNLLVCWPGIIVMHYTGLETFELPPTSQIWWVVIGNGLISLVSDVCWTWSMLLTSPLVISVGLSLAIPLSLFGQMIVNGQKSGVLYWIGSIVVVASFLLINNESRHEADEADKKTERAGPSSSLPHGNLEEV